ncbi:hypothetical protein ACJJTC_009913 [Scirpophaga incertulas]
MDLELSAKEHSGSLLSQRANDRKKSAESLKDLLTRNALPALLSKNTLKNRGFSWNELFVDINEFILKELEKYETSKTFNNVISPLCTSLLHMCVAGANKGKAYLKCDRVLETCLFILKNGRLTKAIGDAYLILLYKHILPCDYYLGFITPNNWEDLLDVCLSSLSADLKLDCYTKLKLLLLVVKNGTQYCQLVIPLRDYICRFKECFRELQNDKKVQECVVEIVINLILVLSTESRLLLCDFTEWILPIVLKFYDHSLEYKKKERLFKLLDLIVLIHHPAGKLQNEDGSLANDWNIWNKEVNDILEIVSLEVEVLQRVRKSTEFVINAEFVSLAAAIYYQIFHSNCAVQDENDNKNSMKRPKLGLNRYKSFADLIYQLRQNTDQSNHVPWLSVIHMYITKYGSSISTADYLSILNILEVLMKGSYQNLDWKSINGTTCMVINNLMASNVYNDDLCEAFLSLWNLSVRNSTSLNLNHRPIHKVLQTLLKTKTLTYRNVHPLVKLYLEGGMPVNESSVETINIVISMFFNKCSPLEIRTLLINWFFKEESITLSVHILEELFMRLLANDNINVPRPTETFNQTILFSTLFDTIDKCILFGEFELQNIDETIKINVTCEENGEKCEVNADANYVLQNFLENILLQSKHFKSGDLLHYIKSLRIVISYLEVVLNLQFMSSDEIINNNLYISFKRSLDFMWKSLVEVLKSNASTPTKVELLKLLKNILTHMLNPLLSLEIRQSIIESFFHYANNIITVEQDIDEEICVDDDDDLNNTSLKYNIIYILAAYCRCRSNYREEILELILDPRLYNFTSNSDVMCAYNCMDILTDVAVIEPPLDQIFMFMQNMCKHLFRSPDATYKLLTILLKILDRLWTIDENMKQNAFIMIRGFLERCQKSFYPVTLTALIHKCALKLIALNAGEISDLDRVFVKCIVDRSKGDIHSMRIYCSYLLDTLINTDTLELDTYLFSMSDVFVINVSQRNQLIFKDEFSNRTLSVLHSLLVLVTAKKSLIQRVLKLILKLQHDKSLDEKIVKKVLGIITTQIDNKPLDVYLNNNILSVLYFWYSEKLNINNMPLPFFGISDQNGFLDKYMKWLISSEILWSCGGNIRESVTLKLATNKFKMSESKILEICFCNLIILCLPYIVADKYKIRYMMNEGDNDYKRSMINANRMFLMTRQILEPEKWSNLFVENIGELLLLAALHLSDHADIKEMIDIDPSVQVHIYQYPKIVFSAILKYFGELTDGDIMLYLCEHQPVAIIKILIKLWDNILQQTVSEYKILAIHAFKTFVGFIPLVPPSEAFVCNYVCNCFGYLINKTQNKLEVKILCLGLRSILDNCLPEKIKLLSKTMSQILSILIIKKDEGFESECNSLLEYVLDNMKQDEDVDMVKSMSADKSVENLRCSSLKEYFENLRTYKRALQCPRYVSLLQLRHFLELNSLYIIQSSKNLHSIRFSEDCNSSMIHQVIHKLNCILDSAQDSKIVTEACNCLAKIGTYDLKTLVTLSPIKARSLVDTHPRGVIASAAINSLCRVVFDEDPAVTNKVAKALNRLLKYKEVKEVQALIDIDAQILQPFASDQDDGYTEFVVNENKLANIADDDFLTPTDKEDHNQWLIKQATAILDVLASESNYFNSLREVCSLKPEVCQNILPPLIGIFLYNSSENYNKIFSQQINKFFKYIWEISFDDIIESSGDITTRSSARVLNQNHKMIIQYMLSIVDIIRLQRHHYISRSNFLESLNYLKLDYEKVAWAATVADQNLSAIYYAELWTMALNDLVPPSSPEFTRTEVLTILRKSYVSIGEMDAIDGCGTAHLTLEREKRKHLINTGQHLDAMLMHDIALSSSRTDLQMQNGIVRSLHKSGMHHLALQYIKSMPDNDQLTDIKYECLSSLGDWSEFVDTRDLEQKIAYSNHNVQSVLKAYCYSCLKDCLNIQMKPALRNKLMQSLNGAKLAVSKLCQELNMMNCQNVYKILSKIQLFADIEDYSHFKCNNLDLKKLLNKWSVQNLPPYQDFKHLEDIICQRNIILEHSSKSFSYLLKDIRALQLQYAELCLHNQRIQMSQRVLATVKRQQCTDDAIFLESKIYWAKGQKDIGLSLLRDVVSRPASCQSFDIKLLGVSLRQYGLWMAESKSDNARNIINKYLKKSLDILSKSDDVQTRQKVYYDIAKFADAEYKQVVTYMNSTVFQNKVKCCENMRDTSTSLRSTQPSNMTRDERKALQTNEMFKQIEANDIASTQAEKATFLQLAIRYYMMSLKECEENNLSIFRVISLWLDNPDMKMDTEGGSFEELLLSIPSRKFISVLPQLAPRLSDEKTAFTANLMEIIKRCAIEHPHHTLPVLFSLKNSNKDKYILNASQAIGSSGKKEQNGPHEPRVVAAEALVRQVMNENAVLAVIVSQMEKLCDAIISFANFKSSLKEQKQSIPPAEKLRKLRNLDAIPLPTLTVPIREDCNYNNITTLVSFDDYFELVGGINCPKKLRCLNSDGVRKIILIKGEDDLRQDAVMQQVFDIVNTLLEKNSITNKNKLLIRTYKVVPMSRQSGILEWCENTTPIGLYLTGSNKEMGAHARYRPQDISCRAARDKLTQYNKGKKSVQEKLVVFLSILKQLKPVFHYFFTEHYLDPITWYERRLAYTKSVATSSMVGYILGIGDRHVQNILIDKITAEVIHIDFGIAFDQGQALLTPETVPFRLTQDIVAGFGCSGVEGIFRRCCEKTMQLLRDNQETLLTILEVLLCDPLYLWIVAGGQPATQRNSSKDTIPCHNGSKSSLAERALLAVGRKLSGSEGSGAGSVAVAGQVAHLISTASDPANLCRLFPGWQPYL